MWDDFYLEHQLVLVPTPIGSGISLHGNTQSVLSSIFSKNDKNRIAVLVEEAKSARARWVFWGFPRDWMNDWELYNEHNQDDLNFQKRIVEEMKRGKTFFLLSDAGLPGLADPGRNLIQACWQHQLKVTSLFFDNSTLLALVLSGFQTSPHFFYGFLPREEGARKEALREALLQTPTTILMETPYRLSKFLHEVKTLTESMPLPKTVEFFLAVNLNQREEKLYRGSIHRILDSISSERKAPFVFLKSSL